MKPVALHVAYNGKLYARYTVSHFAYNIFLKMWVLRKINYFFHKHAFLETCKNV